jgi:hypothetical protein
MWKTVVVFVGGWALIAAGIAMLVLPGQGVLTIIAGVALLATRFAWARRLMDRGRDWARPVTRWLAIRWRVMERRYGIRWPRRWAERTAGWWRLTQARLAGRWRNLKARWNLRGPCPEQP